MTKLSTLALAGVLACAVPAAAQNINDAQIAAIVVTANQVDIDAGRIAAEKASNPGIRKFGQLMASDHAGVNKAAVDLTTRLEVTPEANPTSRALETAGEKNVANLKTLSGKAFDKAYIDHEVAYHQQVIDALDTVLIPGAANAELKALLLKVRPAFVAHLEQAKREQTALHTVTIDATRFEPATLTVAPGDTVVWRNQDILPHTATSGLGVFDSKEIKPGKSWRYVVPRKGLFEYFCTLHPTMKASLRVR